MTNIIVTLLAYLIGSLNMSIIIARLMGKPDPRTQGSGNAGATNMLRTSGKKDAIIVLLGDAIKGIIAVLIARFLGIHGMMLGFVALAAIIGHIFPCYFGFKGGKGVATLLGVLLTLNIWVGLTCIVTWLVVALLSRFASLASICGAIASVIACWVFGMTAYIMPLVLMAVLIIWKHQANIQRLLHGTESKINLKRAP